MIAEIISPLTEFGVAGLMGALWVWERRLSRRRERQLDEAHEQITRDERRVDALMELVRSNTRAIERFAQAQSNLTSMIQAQRGHAGAAAEADGADRHAGRAPAG